MTHLKVFAFLALLAGGLAECPVGSELVPVPCQEHTVDPDACPLGVYQMFNSVPDECRPDQVDAPEAYTQGIWFDNADMLAFRMPHLAVATNTLTVTPGGASIHATYTADFLTGVTLVLEFAAPIAYGDLTAANIVKSLDETCYPEVDPSAHCYFGELTYSEVTFFGACTGVATLSTWVEDMDGEMVLKPGAMGCGANQKNKHMGLAMWMRLVPDGVTPWGEDCPVKNVEQKFDINALLRTCDDGQTDDCPCPRLPDGTCPRLCGDPHFESFSGGQFDIAGTPGKVYNIISTSRLQMNTLFVKTPNVADTYFGAIGIDFDHSQRIQYDASTDVAMVNGEIVDNNGGLIPLRTVNSTVRYYISKTPSRMQLHVPGYMLDINIVNKARVVKHFDMSVSHSAIRHDELPAHGLLGQTERLAEPVEPKDHQGTGIIQGTLEDYTVTGLFGRDFRFNKYH